MNSNNTFKTPQYGKWLLGIVAAVIALGLAAYYGFGVLLVALVAGGIVAAYWPLMLVYCILAGFIGGVISQNRSGSAGSGVWAGIFYALLSLVVVLGIVSLNAVANGF